MTTAREAFEAKMLWRKYGVPGKVAGRYRAAGYKVSMASGEPVDFVARRRGDAIAVKVYWQSGPVPAGVVEALASYSRDAGFKPVLVLYGSGPRITPEARDKARELGVSVRRVRS